MVEARSVNVKNTITTIFPQTGGCSEGLGAFRFFFKQRMYQVLQHRTDRPGGSVGNSRNLLTLGREFESRCRHTNWEFSHKKTQINKCPTSGERLIRGYTKVDSTVDEGKERLNPSREKNQGTHRRRKVGEKSCVTFLLCDPGWYVHKPDVQNKGDDNTTHTPRLQVKVLVYCTSSCSWSMSSRFFRPTSTTLYV